MDCQSTHKNYQEMREVVIRLECWAPEKSQGWRPRVHKFSDGNRLPFKGLYMNEGEERAYFTMLTNCILHPDPDLWCWEPAYVNPKHKKDGRRNIAPKAGKEQEALKQLLLGR